MAMADRLVEDGYRDAGYEYVNIDDCWSNKTRDENGNLNPDSKRFPSGMKALADYVSNWIILSDFGRDKFMEENRIIESIQCTVVIIFQDYTVRLIDLTCSWSSQEFFCIFPLKSFEKCYLVKHFLCCKFVHLF